MKHLPGPLLLSLYFAVVIIFNKAVVAMPESLQAQLHRSTVTSECSVFLAGSYVDPLKLAYLKNHGSKSISYGAFQSGLSHFFHPDGLIAYDIRFWKRLVLGDPLASEGSLGTVLDAFLMESRDPFFVAITAETANHLANRGFYINEMGHDMYIDVQTYDLEGPRKSKLRQAYRKFQRSGYQIRELRAAELDRTEVERVTEKWRSKKNVSDKEVRFLTRPIQYEDELDVRKFYVFDTKNNLVAYYFFDPLYRDGRVFGYSLSFKRQLPMVDPSTPEVPGTIAGLEEAVVVWALELFKNEGLDSLYLGMMPLYKVEDRHYRHSRLMHHTFRRVLAYGDGFLFNFTGLANFKHRFRGVEVPLYMATRHQFNLRPLLGLVNACGAVCPPREVFKLLIKSMGTFFNGAKHADDAGNP